MSAYDDLIELLADYPNSISHEGAEQHLGAHRTEVLAKAIGRLRAVPVQCTALTGPVWYGQGWADAITTLEDIADYSVPDYEAYPGELVRLRALVLQLRAHARKDEYVRVDQLLRDHAASDRTARDTAGGKTTTTVAAVTPQPTVYENLTDIHARNASRAAMKTIRRDDSDAEPEPVPLRWGLDDVVYGDDDTTTLLLSGPAGEPYWLELDPERAAALRDSLSRPTGDWLPTLMAAVSERQGEWTTRRVQRLFKSRHRRGRTRGDARADLKALCASGLLILHDQDPNRVFYTFNTWNGGDH